MAYNFHYIWSSLEIMCIAFVVLLLENTKLFYVLLLFCLCIEICAVKCSGKSSGETPDFLHIENSLIPLHVLLFVIISSASWQWVYFQLLQFVIFLFLLLKLCCRHSASFVFLHHFLCSFDLLLIFLFN